MIHVIIGAAVIFLLLFLHPPTPHREAELQIEKAAKIAPGHFVRDGCDQIERRALQRSVPEKGGVHKGTDGDGE